MYATIADHVKTAELFIKSGANLFAIDSAGRSALLWAAFYGHVDVYTIKLLMDFSNFNRLLNCF